MSSVRLSHSLFRSTIISEKHNKVLLFPVKALRPNDVCCKVRCDGGACLPLAVTGFSSTITLYNMLETRKKIDLLLPSHILEEQIPWLPVKITLRRK